MIGTGTTLTLYDASGNPVTVVKDGDDYLLLVAPEKVQRLLEEIRDAQVKTNELLSTWLAQVL